MYTVSKAITICTTTADEKSNSVEYIVNIILISVQNRFGILLSTMWSPFIFLLLVQGYLTTADPIPSVDEPYNAFRWVKEALLTDSNNETRWLRKGLEDNSAATSAWIKQALVNTRDIYSNMTEAIKNVTYSRVKLVDDEYLWYVDQALDDNQDAETWKRLQAGRNDTEEALEWFRGALTNETQEILTWAKALVDDTSQGIFSFRGSILTLAMDAYGRTSSEESSEISSPDDKLATTLWGRFLQLKNELIKEGAMSAD
ncbi:uncharacterized protein LOC125500706 isoform X2 [Athalia rosae]|nr:uncharacterized protein LOC125500706 isoform X2 [Athalia rosae]